MLNTAAVLIGITAFGGVCALAHAAEPADIDASRFEVRGVSEPRITVRRTVGMTPTEAFAFFTSSDAWAKAMGVESKIELAIGGPFEFYFGPNFPEGQRGSEGCQILSYLPGRMVSYSWNAPPSIPTTREKRSWVVVNFHPAGEANTEIELNHLGFGEGDDWDKTADYFERAWPSVLGVIADAHPPVGAQPDAESDSLAAVARLAGVWRSADDHGMAEEVWTRPHQGSMLGMFRWLLSDGRVGVYELLEIEATDAGPTMTMRHFNGDLAPWASEADGPLRFMLDQDASDLDAGRIVWAYAGDDGALDRIVNDTTTAGFVRTTVSFPAESGRDDIVIEMHKQN